VGEIRHLNTAYRLGRRQTIPRRRCHLFLGKAVCHRDINAIVPIIGALFFLSTPMLPAVSSRNPTSAMIALNPNARILRTVSWSCLGRPAISPLHFSISDRYGE